MANFVLSVQGVGTYITFRVRYLLLTAVPTKATLVQDYYDTTHCVKKTEECSRF